MKVSISDPLEPGRRGYRIAVVAVMLLIAAGTSYAQLFELSGITETATGYTNYRIDIMDGAVASLLEFPVDGYAAGAAIAFTPANAAPDRSPFPNMRLDLRGIFSLTDPAMAMKDSDWLDYVYNPPLRWSYTESRVDHRSVRLDAQFRIGLAFKKDFAWYAAAGYEYHRIDQAVMGYKGWQLDVLRQDATGGRMDFSGHEEAIRYAVTYHRPSFGAVFLWKPAGGFSLETVLGLLAVFSSDTDDHLLRGKRSSSLGIGTGLRAEISAEYRFTAGPVSPFIGLDLSYLRTFTKGSETQEWYRDEGDTPAGTVIAGLDHSTSLFLYSAAVRLGVRYEH